MSRDLAQVRTWIIIKNTHCIVNKGCPSRIPTCVSGPLGVSGVTAALHVVMVFRRGSEFFLLVRMGMRGDHWMRTNVQEVPRKQDPALIQAVLGVIEILYFTIV